MTAAQRAAAANGPGPDPDPGPGPKIFQLLGHPGYSVPYNFSRTTATSTTTDTG